MSLIEGIIGPIAGLIDKIIPDPKARDAAKLELIKLQGSQEMDALRTQLSAVLAEAQSADPWTSRARPSFLYVMYAMLLWAIPMGLIAAVQKNDDVVTAGGLMGKVTKVADEYVEVEIAPNVRVKAVKSTIANVQPRNAKAAND